MVEGDDTTPATDESKTLVPHKVHLRGLDTLSTEDIRNYVKAQYGPTDRVEWIDDTSANLLFSSESAARDALVALSSVEIADPSALAPGEETLPAKPVEGKPEITLYVRLAVQTDRKQPGAAQRSRFYLMNPEYDPEERRRHQRHSSYRDRRGRRDSDRDRRPPRFEASMYDDAPRRARSTPSRSRSRSRRGRDRSYSPDRSYARENRGKELFGGGGGDRRRSRRRSSRSASPRRDMDVDGEERPSSSGNRVKAQSLREDRRNSGRELFPTKRGRGAGGSERLDQLETAIGSAQLKDEDRPKMAEGFSIRGAAAGGRNGGAGFSIKGAANARELFPGRLDDGAAGNTGKELLDKRRNRQKAEDLFS